MTYHSRIHKAALFLGVFAVLFLCVSSVTAVPQAQGSHVINALEKQKQSQTILSVLQSLKQKFTKPSLLKQNQPQGFFQVMISLLIKLVVNIAQLTKGVTIGLINLAIVILKLSFVVLVGTQKILTVAAISTFYMGIQASIALLKFFKSATPVVAKIASVIAKIITPIVGAIITAIVFAVSAGIGLALLLAIPLVLLLVIQSMTGGETFLDQILDYLEDLLSTPAPEEE